MGSVGSSAFSFLQLINDPVFLAEAIGMLIQFFGALAVAWFTVRFAFKRYVAERKFDREYSSLIDVLEAISEMKKINKLWLYSITIQTELNEDYDRILDARWSAARQRIDAVIAVATIILRDNAHRPLEALDAALEAKYEDRISGLAEIDAALSTARTTLIGIGKVRFGSRYGRP